jgi:hypothetical protein
VILSLFPPSEQLLNLIKKKIAPSEQLLNLIKKYHTIRTRRAYTSIGIDLDRDPGYTSPARGLERPQPGPYVSPFTRSRL